MISRLVLSSLLLSPLAFGVARPATATAFTLTFLRAIPAPDGNTFAIDIAPDGSLWVHGLVTHTFYQLDPGTGAVLRSFSSNGSTLYGIGTQGGTLFGSEEPAIARFDIASGTQLPSLTGPSVGGSRGLTFISGQLYVAGVLAGFPGQVRLGQVDASSGALLSSCAPPGLVNSDVIGRIGSYACFVMTNGPDTLRIVDPDTGALLEDHFLFAGSDVYYSAVSSPTELFVTRRDLDQIWVYSYETPVGVRRTSWGAIHARYR